MLQNIEKKAYDSWSCIGVFKRYTMIGENNLAEKAITKSLKKNPDNLELTNRSEHINKHRKDLKRCQYKI